MVLLRPKWLAGHALVLLLVGAFVTAGFWQLSRNREANDKLDAERAAFAALAPPARRLDLRRMVRRSRARHRDRPLRRRTPGIAAQPVTERKIGYDVLTPLQMDSGDVIIVDRGWVNFDRVATGLHDTGVPTGPCSCAGYSKRQPVATRRTGQARGRTSFAPAGRRDAHRPTATAC